MKNTTDIKSRTIVHGYGVYGEQLEKVQTIELVKFVKKHLPNIYLKMIEDISEYIDNTDDIEDYDYAEWLNKCSANADFNNGWVLNKDYTDEVDALIDATTFASPYFPHDKYLVIAAVMRKETGISFSYYSLDEGEYAIVLPLCMPWEFNEKDKNCTPESLEKIFKEYFQELGVNNIEVDMLELYKELM